jgi:hypothetical protein
MIAHRFVIDDLAIAQHPVMAVIGKRVQRNIGDDRQFRGTSFLIARVA